MVSEVTGMLAMHGISETKERRMCFKRDSLTVSNSVDKSSKMRTKK